MITHENSNGNLFDFGIASPKSAVPFFTPNYFHMVDRNQIHFAYLFASPLVLETSFGSFYDCLEPISFSDEIEGILD